MSDSFGIHRVSEIYIEHLNALNESWLEVEKNALVRELTTSPMNTEWKSWYSIAKQNLAKKDTIAKLDLISRRLDFVRQKVEDSLSH